MKPETKQYSSMVGGKSITFETGKLAGQAGGSVTVRLGDTMIFAAATMSSEVRLGIDYFPLTVDYEERMYAGGRIPGSFFRREGRPSEEAILISRLTDRPLRPLFPKDLRNDVQVIMYSFSVDGENPIDILSINAASAALTISDVPWGGPVGAVRIGRVNGQLIVNPTASEQDASDLDLRIAGTRDAILMVECGAQEVPENVMVEALNFGHQSIQPLIDLQEQMAREIGKPKQEYPPFILTEAIQAPVTERAAARLNEVLDAPHTRAQLNTSIADLQKEIVDELTAQDAALVPSVIEAFDETLKSVVRQRILERQIRPDGRGLTEIRPIWGEVGISPRAHGSGLFTRGETQVLTLATLGTPRDAQEIDSLTGTDSKRYMHQVGS